MAEGFLIDTNVLIDAQMNNLPKSGLRFLSEVIDSDFTISFVSYIEFLGYKNASELTEQFISLANVIEIDRDIIEKCILLRRTTSIKLPDAIIAATAISHDLTLITRNIDDFKNIDALKLINPWDI